MSAAPTTFPAATPPGSQLAPGAILTRARCLSFQIAQARRPPGRLGNTAGDPSPPRITRYPFSSSKHQPTHNIRGCSSERNEIPVRVRNDADLRAGRRDPTLTGTLGPQVLIRLVAPWRLLVGHSFHPSSSPPNP